MEALGRVLAALGNIDDEKLSTLVPTLIPQIISHLNTDDPLERQKAVEVLSHLSRRLRPNQSIRLPCLALVDFCCDRSSSSFTRNFSAAYLELGCGRIATCTERGVLGAVTLHSLNKVIFGSSVELTLSAVALHMIEEVHRVPQPSAACADDLLSGDRYLCATTDLLFDATIAPPIKLEYLKQLSNGFGTVAASQAAGGDTKATSASFAAPPGLSPMRMKRMCGRPLGNDEAWTTLVRHSWHIYVQLMLPDSLFSHVSYLLSPPLSLFDV